MDQRAVVALVVVLRDHLPVRCHLVGVPVGEHERLRCVRADDPLECSHVVGEAGSPLRQPPIAHRVRGVHEDPAVPAFDGQLDQGVLRTDEVLTVAETRRPAQLPTEVVGPCVIRAQHRLAVGRGTHLEQLVSAVPAGVRERSQDGVRDGRVPGQQH